MTESTVDNQAGNTGASGNISAHGTELADRILTGVRRALPAVEAEVTIHESSLGLTRFANSAIHQNLTETSTAAILRLHANGRTCTVTGVLPNASTSVATAVSGLVERAISTVDVLPPDPSWPGLSEPNSANNNSGNQGGAHPTPGAPGFDPATAAADPSQRAAAVRAFVDATEGLSAAGICQTTGTTTTYANTIGNHHAGQASAAIVDAIARAAMTADSADPRARKWADGVARRTATALADLDPAALGATAAEKARASVTPISLEPGRYEVVLEPSCVAQILQFLGMYGFNGLAVNQHRSFVRVGEAQFDERVTLIDNPIAANAGGLPFDGDGTARAAHSLVESGVTGNPVHSRRTAAEADTTSTGHAVAGFDAIGALPMHTALSAGPDGRVPDLIAGIERGLLVTDLWYVRVLDPRTLVSTGLTRNGLWLIENGEIGPAVADLRFTQSYVDALGPGAVRGVGSHAETLSPIGFSTHLLATNAAPPVHLASWNFTGNAAG